MVTSAGVVLAPAGVEATGGLDEAALGRYLDANVAAVRSVLPVLAQNSIRSRGMTPDSTRPNLTVGLCPVARVRLINLGRRIRDQRHAPSIFGRADRFGEFRDAAHIRAHFIGGRDRR